MAGLVLKNIQENSLTNQLLLSEQSHCSNKGLFKMENGFNVWEPIVKL